MSQEFGPTGSTPAVAITAGSTNGGRVQIGDIRAKLTEIETEVRGATTVDRPGARTTTLVVVGAAVVLIAAAFVLGRRRGRRKSTWVEIRRL